jgi:hypothetical protein
MLDSVAELFSRFWNFLGEHSIGWARWVGLCLLPFALYFVLIDPFLYLFKKRFDNPNPSRFDALIKKIMKRLPLWSGYLLLPLTYIAILYLIFNLIGPANVERFIKILLPPGK